MIKKLLFSSLFLCAFSLSIFAQSIVPPPMPKADQREMLAKIKAESPELAKYQNRMFEINGAINAIVQDYNNGKMSKEKAKENLRPLLKEQIEMMNSTDFMVEQQLFAILSQK